MKLSVRVRLILCLLAFVVAFFIYGPVSLVLFLISFMILGTVILDWLVG